MKFVRSLIALGSLAALPLCTAAQGAFLTYSGSGSDTTFVGLASDTIDLGFVSSNYTVRASLGLAVSSASGTTVTPDGHVNLQVVQGCTLAAGSCAGHWFDIPVLGLGTAFSAAAPTSSESFDTGFQTLATPAARSFREVFSADFAPKGTTGVSGTLSVVAVPEPTVWLMMLGGIGLLGWMRIRKSEGMG